MIDAQPCAACEHLNALPFLFCEQCGAPRIRLGWLRMIANITFAMGAFLVSYLLSDAIGWDWPIYSFYAFFILQFMLVLVSGRWKLTFKILAWTSCFYVLFMAVLTTLNLKGVDFFLHLASFIPDAAADYPAIFFGSIGGVLALVLIPFFIHWSRQYGWLNGYRIVLLALFTLSFGVVMIARLLEWIDNRNLLPSQEYFLDQFVRQSKPVLDGTLGMFAWITLRVLVFEIFVTSALQGYRAAMHARLPDAGRLARESALVRSMVRLGQVLRRFLLLLEHMVTSLLSTLAALGRSLWEVLLAFLRDLALPALMLATAGSLLYVLTILSRDYIAENTLSDIVRLMATVAGLLVCAMVFLACVTPYSPGRIAYFAAEFGGWLMPNMLVFFLLTSVSLYITGRLWPGGGPGGEELPFRLGYLTRADAIVLALLMGVVLWKRRSLFQVQEGAEEPAAPAKTKPAGDSAPIKPVKAKVSHRPKMFTAASEAMARGAGIFGKLSGRVQETLKGPVRELAGRVQGKPVVVDQLSRARQRREEKIAQLRSLQQVRETIAPDAFENLWNEARSELTILEIEQNRLQTELDRQYGEKMMEKATLEARLAALNLENHEGDDPQLQDTGQAQTVMAEIQGLTAKIDVCEKSIAFLAPLAGQPPAGVPRNAVR